LRASQFQFQWNRVVKVLLCLFGERVVEADFTVLLGVATKEAVTKEVVTDTRIKEKGDKYSRTKIWHTIFRTQHLALSMMPYFA
ncbi:hypothetical protein ACJMK2_044255, partial [Sinanodonta woodiana]